MKALFLIACVLAATAAAMAVAKDLKEPMTCKEACEALWAGEEGAEEMVEELGCICLWENEDGPQTREE